MTTAPRFRIDVHQNEYLPAGSSTVDAVLTVAAETDPAGRAPPAAEVIIIDASASMTRPTKLAAAKRAASAAIDTLRTGTGFAIVAGNDEANLIYPGGQRLAIASRQTKAQAKRAIERLGTGGGTAMGRWLRLADELFETYDGSIRHAILLTDGRNMRETAADLERTLHAVAGHFVCDCRGIGTDWRIDELRAIADTMLGTVDIIAQPADLEADFRAMTAAAMNKAIANVVLRLRTPHHARIVFVREVSPLLTDLTARRTERQPGTGDYPIGSWGAETREYHVRVTVKPGAVGDTLLACRANIVSADQEGLARERILATWSADPTLTDRTDPEVAHYQSQAELATAIQDGLRARDLGDDDVAVARLGHAVMLANASGHQQATQLLAFVVDIDDATRGRVRLKNDVPLASTMALDTRSTVTKRFADS